MAVDSLTEDLVDHALGIVADFDDWDGYVAYRDHPAHVAVGADLILPVLAGRGAVQHEID